MIHFFDRHNDDEDDYHLLLHDPFIVAHSIDESSGVFMAISSFSMLMNPLKAMLSGWQVQIQGDVTFKVCREDVALLGFGVNSMGAKYNLCALSLIPQSAEDQRAYSETWKAVNRSIEMLLRKFKRCPLKDCMLCDIITVILQAGEVQELLSQDHFAIPVALAGSDNNLSLWKLISHMQPCCNVSAT